MASPPSPADYMASAPSPVSNFQWDWSDYFTAIADLLTLVCYGWFSILIGLDVWRAIKQRATWLPGKAFSLTGVTVQIIVWWTSVSSINNECEKDVNWEEIASYNQLVVSGRVAVCVVIGYLLPEMAAPNVRTFLALGTSICIQIASEVRKFQKQHGDIQKEDARPWATWAEIANSMLFMSIIVLGSLLVCTILGSQTVHGLLKQRTSAIFSVAKEDEFRFSIERMMSISWNDFEDEVLSSWLVARVCRGDYVICRSVLSSAVGVVVTLCVIIFLLSNTFRNTLFTKESYSNFRIDILFLLFSFIIIR